MANKEYGVFYIQMSQSVGRDSRNKSAGTGAFKLAWRAPIDTYPKEIAGPLGIVAVDAKKPEPGLVFGSNSPRAARLRINVQASQGKNKSYIVFANPSQLSTLINGNILRGKKYKGGTITSVSLPKTSTNPSRSKKTTKKTGRNRRG